LPANEAAIKTEMVKRTGIMEALPMALARFSHFRSRECAKMATPPREWSIGSRFGP